MRKTILIFSLAGLTVMAGASDAFAQRRGYDGGWGYAPGISMGAGRGGAYLPYGYSSIGVGRGGAYSPYGYNFSRSYGPYYPSYGYSYAPNYYDAAPRYYSEPAYVVPATQIRPAYYQAPTAAQQSVSVTVLVPDANAQVWFEDGLTSQTGTQRMFHSPPLEPNRTFTYTVKARWMENGQAINQESQIKVQAGQSYTITFRNNSRIDVPLPLPRLPNAIPRE